ncbi:MAG: methyltransferase domain-containing protein [Planctomycetota bacterium]
MTFPRNVYFAAKHRFIREFVKSFPPGSTILDACCGCGFATADFTDEYRIYGIDIQPDAIRFCQENHDGTYSVGDVYSLKFGDGMFDGVVLNDAIEHLYEPRWALRELHRVLKPSGRIEICTENYDSYLWLSLENTWYRIFGGNCKPYDHNVHPSRFTPKKLRRSMGEFFEIEKFVLRNLGMKMFSVASKNGFCDPGPSPRQDG